MCNIFRIFVSLNFLSRPPTSFLLLVSLAFPSFPSLLFQQWSLKFSPVSHAHSCNIAAELEARRWRVSSRAALVPWWVQLQSGLHKPLCKNKTKPKHENPFQTKQTVKQRKKTTQVHPWLLCEFRSWSHQGLFPRQSGCVLFPMMLAFKYLMFLTSSWSHRRPV